MLLIRCFWPFLACALLLTACSPEAPASSEPVDVSPSSTSTGESATSTSTTVVSGTSALDTAATSTVTATVPTTKGEAITMTTTNTTTTVATTTTATPTGPVAIGADRIPARTPTKVGTMTMHKLFYKTQPHEGVADGVDLRDQDNATVMAALCLQGLVARESDASIFVITCQNDVSWKQDLTRRYGVEFQELSVPELFDKYRSYVKKLVVYGHPDGDNYEMVMAINMAAIANGLPVTTALAESMSDYATLPREDVQGRWNGRVEAYTWGIENVLPHCTKHYVGACDGNDTVWDYLYATKSFCFWLDYTSAPEREVIERILRSDYTMPGLVFGYGEGGDLLLNTTAPEGFAYFVSDYFVNATFLSSFTATKESYAQNPIRTDLKPEDGVMYVSLYISDGDNVQFNQKASQYLWSNTTHRGTYPVGLELNPALYELAPTMLEWYISRVTKNDELMGGPAGFSYIWEDIYKPSAFEPWHAVNNYFLQKAGMRVVASSRVPPTNEDNRFMALSCIMGSLDWGDPSEAEQSFSGNAYLYDGKPLIVSTNCGLDIVEKFEVVEPDPARPTFYSLCITQGTLGEAPGGMYYGYRYINEKCDELKARYGDRIQFVLPSDLLALAKQTLKPSGKA